MHRCSRHDRSGQTRDLRHYPESSRKDFVGEIQRNFSDFSVNILNDTACFAYAEKVYTQISEKDFAFINFGKGIGATLFIRNEMLGHACASYTQFGHYSINPKGKLCSCGNRGCLELMIGEGSLKDRIAQTGSSPAFKNQLLSHTLTWARPVYMGMWSPAR
ncbi:ROK family protein [Blautia sp. RD014234]|nr:ROK family protein [Blautia parvula]